MSSRSKGFLRPADEDFASAWKEDKPDLDSAKDSAFIFNATPSLALAAQRHKLPIRKNKDHILYLVEKFQVVIVVGETGCGKSTQIPQYLIEAGWCSSGDEHTMIGVTEPRRVAATTLAARVAEEKNCRLGELVGYSIRFDECFDRSRTKIKYLTEGILVREMMGDPLLKDYAVIMLDEAHERTAQTDIIMGLLKKILRKRRELRLIVSSATVDAEYMRDFFNTNNSGGSADKDTAAIMSIAGSNYSVDVFYLSDPCPDYVRSCVETTMKLHEVEPPGDVLIFLTGMDEVDHCVSLLQEHARQQQKPSKHGLKIWALPMYGSLPAHDQLKVFRPAMRGSRKIVVATNIAETSITIEGIVYVVDSMFVKLKWYNPDTNADVLIVREISRASAEQRAGRAGRTRPGQCYRLCTEEDFAKRLPLNTPPEMQRTDLAGAVLQLKALGIDNVVRFQFPSAPPSKNLISSLELLYALGAIDDDGNLTRPLGDQMSELPIHPTLSKILLSSAEFGCSQEITSIVAMLQVENVFLKPPGQANKARACKRQVGVFEGDLLTLLNVYNAFKQQGGDARHWCSSHFLKFKGLRRADELCQQLRKTLARFRIPIKSTNDQDAIRRCIVSGLFPNAAYLHMSGSYRTVRGDTELSVHPTSVLYTVKQPSWVVFTELAHTNKVLMKDITVIDPAWLEVLAPHFYERTTLTR